MNRISMILLSGGIGTRMGVNTPKQFLLIGGKPLIVHVLEKVESIEAIAEIIIPSPAGHMDRTQDIIRKHQFAKPTTVIEGGATRQQSVRTALQKVTYEQVLLHEAVRPSVLREEFERLIHCDTANVTYGTNVPFTVLEGDGFIERALDRSRLINIQLPQKFDAGELVEAHERAFADGLSFTEDASLHFHYHRKKIKVLEGTEYNIKITRPIDQKIGEIIYKDYVLGGE